MTRVIVSEDCGNSPKNIFLQKLTIAFAKCDSKFILDSVTDDIRWNVLGNQLIEGKNNFSKSQIQFVVATSVALLSKMYFVLDVSSTTKVVTTANS